MNDSLGDRMKNNYENRSRFYLTRRTPVIVRLDGRCFHTILAKAEKPFDNTVAAAMWMGAIAVAKEMQGFKLAYVQSDEVSFLLTDYDDINTEAWFDYNLSKMLSISSSIMSLQFKSHYEKYGCFDARAFNIPESEISNYFLWRYRDWTRNSLLRYCQSIFSHKEMQGKKQKDLHEMLHEKGKNWANLSPVWRNGMFINNSKTLCEVDEKLDYSSMDNIVTKALFI